MPSLMKLTRLVDAIEVIKQYEQVIMAQKKNYWTVVQTRMYSKKI